MCSAEEAYEQAGLPCPPHRTPADHYIFSMNTDFQKFAADFETGNAMPDLEANSGSLVAPVNAQAGIKQLRAHFDGVLRVRTLCFWASFHLLCGVVVLHVVAPVNAQAGIKQLRTHFDGALRVRTLWFWGFFIPLVSFTVFFTHRCLSGEATPGGRLRRISHRTQPLTSLATDEPLLLLTAAHCFCYASA